MLECELKFRFASPEEAKTFLASKGITLSEPLAEENAVLDTPDHSLSRRRILLRIRSTGGATILTVKTPVEDDRMKVRREFETGASCSPETLLEMFETIGFSISRRYSKIRRSGRSGNATICLDELHFGTFLEFEAPDPVSLERAVEALGLDSRDGIKLNYLELEDGAGRDA